MRKNLIVLRVIGPFHDYATYTAYLWLNEIKGFIEEEFKLEVKVEWLEDQKLEEYPIFLINDEKVFDGLPGEESYLYEIIKSNLERKLRDL